MFSIFEFDLVDGLSSVPVPWVSYDTDTAGQSKLDGYLRIRLRCVAEQYRLLRRWTYYLVVVLVLVVDLDLELEVVWKYDRSRLQSSLFF